MLSKFGLKVAALVLVGTVSSMAQGPAPMDISAEDWNYLSNFKLWGTEGISFGNRPEFYDSRHYNRTTNENDFSGYADVDPDTLGWVGTAKGNLSTGEKGWLDGPIIVGGSITSSANDNNNRMYLVTGPIRTSNGGISVRYRGTTCTGSNQSGNCSYDLVPPIRSDLKVPELKGANLSGSGSFNVSGRTVLDVNSRCPGNEICDIYLNSIDFANDSRLVVQMPEGGRPTRIFVNKLNFGTHPEIVVSHGMGDLKQKEYQGNLLIYVNSDITFANIDNVSIMGTIVSTGTIKLVCNIVFAGQFIAKKIEVGNEIRAENFVFKKFDPHIELSILDEKSKNIPESSTWETIQVGLSEASKADVTFSYCFDFYSAEGVSGTYAGYVAKTGQIPDVGAADASHKFPICNKGEVVEVKIPAGETKAEAIYIKPMIDGAVEKNEKLWFQVKDLKGATLASDYEDEKGYQIFIVSNDKLPTVSSELEINVNEDEKHTFTAAEFKFQHETQEFAAVIITSLPASGTLLLNGEAVKSGGDPIAVSNFSKFTYTPDLNQFGNNYATFGYRVVGDGTVDNTSIEYTATINVIPVNDKPAVSDVVFTVNELDHAVAGGPIEVTDVSNERNKDTYTYKLVDKGDYAAFSDAFEIVKLTDQNATIKVKTGAVLDYSKKKEYIVYATVSDNAATETSVQAGPLTSEQFKITVKIKNENDDPVIKPQDFTIAEKKADGSDWPSGTFVGKVVATDPDDDPLSFTIDASENVPFKFLNSTNELVVTDGSKLDYEAQTVWTFKVVVSDGQGGSASTTVTVNITDVNEKPEPENVKSQYSVAENSEAATVVGSFEVFDNDKISASYETLTYTLKGPLTGVKGGTTAKDMGEIFEVKEKSNIGGARTVQILVKSQALLDYEALFNGTDATYPVTITIADAENSVEVKTKIAVTDVNERHTATGGTFYLLEHSAGGENVCAAKYDDDGNCADYGKITFNDPDLNNALKFKMSEANTSADAKAFTVDYQGYVKSSGDVEFEYDGTSAQHKYTFLVTVYDNDFSVDVEVTVNIEDIEEPKITLTSEGEVPLKENAQSDEEVIAFSKEALIAENPAMQEDFDKIGNIKKNGYSVGDIVGKNGEAIFKVYAQDGTIMINDNSYLDFETLAPDNNKYTVQINVQGELGSLTISRTIVVVDVNESPESKDTTFFVDEDLAGGMDVGKLLAWDPDSCSTIAAKACKNGLHALGFNKLVYSIVDEDDDLPFEINQSSGMITLKDGEKLDFTKKSVYEFNVKISDRSLDASVDSEGRRSNPSLSTTAKVTIKVLDVNRPSEFKVLSDLYETEENVKVGTSLNTMVGSTLTVGKIVVYDEDEADIDKLKISITDNDATTARDAFKLFEVVQEGKTDSDYLSTFVIKTKKGINYEDLYKATDKSAIFNVTLTIDDGSTKFAHTSQTTKIRVVDVNEEPSVVEPKPFTIAENTTKATSLGKISADDPDIYNASYGTLYFSLKGDEAAQFDIDASTGELFTINNAKFDYETKSSYKFKAVVTDKKFTKEVDVVVNITDVSETPTFKNPPALAVDENSKKGAEVGSVVATDDDCKDTHIATCKMPTYSLAATDIAADDYKKFKIDNNGKITVAEQTCKEGSKEVFCLNYEKKKEYSVRVVATDGSDKTLSSYVDVTIKINDVNDVPTYEKKEYVFEIHESAPKGQFVGSVVADDEDTWSKLTYALSDYVDNSKDSEVFKIDPETGKIYLNATIDYETKNMYQVWAKATDNGKDKGFNNETASTLVTINLIDDPDKPVIIDDGKKGYDVKENTDDNNTPTGYEIACYEVKDQDKGQVATLVPFVKDAGNTDADRLFDAKLKKNGSKYEVCLTVKNGAKLNYETIAHEHNVIVSVMDADNQTAEVEKTITIIDVNEMPIISGSVNFSFYEDKAPHVIGKLFPDDLDTAETFRDDIFTVVGGDVDLFEISEDGKIKTKRKFDYETEEKRTFELIVALSDRDKTGYPKLTTQEKLTITLQDLPEVPEITTTEFDVDENSKEGVLVGVIKSTDPDGDGKLIYEMTEPSPYVTVSKDGEIKVAKDADIDYEKMQEFTITVTVKDEDGLQSDAEILIKVNDLNEPPTIKPQTFVFYEDDPPGTKTGPIEASDPDTKNEKFSKLTYSLVDSSDVFSVTPEGDIVVKSKLDYETQKSYVVKVAVTDGKSSDTTDVTINIENVVEKSEVEITRVEAGDSIYVNPPKENPIYTNKDVILVEWKQDGKTKSSLDTLKEGKNVIIKKYKDPSRDLEGADTVIVFYSTAAPLVEVTAKKTVVTADNIYTVVEGVDKKDSSIYVNKEKKDVLVIVKDTVAGLADTFDVDVALDTISVPNNIVKTLTDVAKSQPTLNKNPKTTVKENPINGEMTKRSYEETVNGKTVTVSYNVDNKGKIIKEAVIDENGEKVMTEVIEVSTTVVVKNKNVVVSYKADANTGKMLYGDSEGNLLTSKPSSSSSKPTSSSSSKKGNSSSSSKKGSETSDEVDLKVGVGSFTVTYDAIGVDGNKATITYVVDEKGNIVANEEGDRGYLVTYTYTNKYGNTADKSVFMVLDKLAPVVKILSPAEGDVVYANVIDVDWCIAIDGNEKNCVMQDTLNFQSLTKGVNKIQRVYRDKAGNETVAEVSVMMKRAKDVDIALEKPMIIIPIDTVDKYYSVNPPEEDQVYAVTIVNPTTQKEKEVVKGFADDSKNKDGSGDEPYPGLDGHIGPTFQIDMRLPTATAVGGLATLDDIIVNGDMVPLDGVDAAESKKATVKDYVKEYCSSEFQAEYGKSKDFSKLALYTSSAHVTLWFYTFEGGRFVDKYSFDYDVEDADFVDKAGLMKFFFEMKPDMNGELRDSHGRLYGTGPFIVKTTVDLRSKLRCMVPPIKESAQVGDVLKSSDELKTRFGYRRPVLHGNERPFQKKSSSKSSSTKSSSTTKKK